MRTGLLPTRDLTERSPVMAESRAETIWRVRHVETGVTILCRDRAEAEAHVRESASGPWVAEQVSAAGEDGLPAAAEIANEFNWRHYGVPAPQFATDGDPCPRRQCRGRVPHSRLVHWLGWVRR